MDKLTPVTSSNIAAVGHDPSTNELHVQFKSGGTHIYSGVTAEDHNDLIAAESIGSHFHRHIRTRPSRKKEEV